MGTGKGGGGERTAHGDAGAEFFVSGGVAPASSPDVATHVPTPTAATNATAATLNVTLRRRAEAR